MDFQKALDIVLKDARSKSVPILFVVQTLIIIEDNHLLKEEYDVRKLSTESDNVGTRNRRGKGLSATARHKHSING